MADLTQLRAQIRRRAEFAVSNASPQLQQTLRSTSPRVTGRLEQNTSVTARGLEATAKAATPYASFVKDGTRAGYPIRPKKGKYLAFFWPGDNRKNKRRLPDGRALVLGVRHPGIKANPWWNNAIRDWPRLLEAALRRAPNG